MVHYGHMKVRELGHVSLFVRDLDATRRFYRDVLGLAETGTGKDGRIVFFSAGVHHHDVSCELARAEGPGPQPKGVPGLYHIAFAVGTSLDDLAGARRDAIEVSMSLVHVPRPDVLAKVLDAASVGVAALADWGGN